MGYGGAVDRTRLTDPLAILISGRKEAHCEKVANFRHDDVHTSGGGGCTGVRNGVCGGMLQGLQGGQGMRQLMHFQGESLPPAFWLRL